MTKLIIVRHGQSEANVEGIYAAHTDAPLSELGRKQAERVGEALKDQKIDAIYSSNLQRAHDTAVPTARAKGLPVVDREDLREIFGGEWEGKRFADLIQEYPEEYGVWLRDVGRSRCVGGESMEELSERLWQALQRIAEAHPEETVLITSHAAAIRTLCTRAKGLPVERMKEVPWVGNASISTFCYEAGNLIPLALDQTDHLNGLESNLPKNV